MLVRSVSLPRGGVFSGLSKTVSSLFFGSQSASEVQDIRRVLTYHDELAGTMALALTTKYLRRWQISQVSEKVLTQTVLSACFKCMRVQHDQVVSDIDVVSLLKDLVLIAGWMHTVSDLSVQTVDMQLCDNNVAILFKVSNDSLSELGVGMEIFCNT